MKYDLFISYANEDKSEIASPLANQLLKVGYDVWFDEFALKLGDSLRRNIDAGLSSSKYGVVIISRNFLNKGWPQWELDSLIQREIEVGYKVILPIWHNIARSDIAKYSQGLAGKVAVDSTVGIEEISYRIMEVIGDPRRANKEVERLVRDRKRVIGLEFVCPKCGTEGVITGIIYSDDAGYDEFECDNCRYTRVFNS